MGPNRPNQVTLETNDIAYISPMKLETTSGTIVWQNGEVGEKSINLLVEMLFSISA